jgi:hypothetical protein
MFSQNDLLQIQKKGITLEQIEIQLRKFKIGFPYLNISAPATINDGIIKFSDEEITELETFYKENKADLTIFKFVPASGAATRMFKNLFEFLSTGKQNNEADKFLANLKHFAFYSDLETCLQSAGKDINNISAKELIEALLLPAGLNYGNLPKGLLKFHSYGPVCRTSIEEHLIEGAQYARTGNNKINLHFTISPEHSHSFIKLLNSKLPDYEKELHVLFQVTYSIQKSSTDTIAADNHNKPFRDKDGSIIFRPGGHGALLENLNELKGDLIFIKNIDNVVPDRLKAQTILYKNALAGYLLKIQKKIKELILAIDNNSADIAECQNFIENNLGYVFPESFHKADNTYRLSELKKVLNRPIRVCGMVKNSGEPGGGPFWVTNTNGVKSLQILESSQFNMENELDREIFKRSSHFNPVDLVIYTKDYMGNKFELTKFTDPETGFISVKSSNGKELKALELPGLWNGAMANWNTIFVEVPLITFNPVKTVTDLIRDEHRND